MPRATISTDSIRYELKSLPEGFVELRRMPYGKWLERQEIALRMTISSQGRGQKGASGDVAMANRAVTAFELKQCLVDHNLEDDAGNKLDLTVPSSLDRLDSRIGDEIGRLINELHEFGDGLGNSNSGFEA